MKKILNIIVGAVMVAASWGVQAKDGAVTIGYQTGDINVQLMYAAQTGLFEKNGLQVKLVAFPAGPAMLPALASKDIDLAWMGEFPAVTAYSNGMALEILMMERLDFTNVRLSVNPKAGIQELKDLKGKRIGASVGSTSHNHLLHALAKAGLKQDDVTVVNLTPANMPAAYLAGQIDAALTWEPNIGLIEKEGAKPIATTRSLDMITGGIWVARPGFIEQQPQDVQRFLKVWRQAQADYKKDPKNVRQYEAARVKQTAAEFDALIARQSASHPSFEELLTADFMGAPGKELDSRLMKHLQSIGQFLLTEKRINALPANWAPLFNTKPIQQFLANEKK